MKNAGLTLLEVMAAIAIFALTATSIMKAAGDHLQGIAVLEEATFSNWVADNRLQQVVIEDVWPPQNNKRGTMEMAGRTWYWQQVVSATQDKELRQVEIIVTTDQKGENVATSLVTFVANPRPAKGDFGFAN
ncbi:MAG: type II secretion system protein GspI [Alteromonadaceae bacterium]|nr:type II secretion system protein GspI [Alteromonadaceae bacterium]